MNAFAVSLNTDFFIARFSCHFPFSVTAVVCHILFLLLTISFFLLHYSFILPFLSIKHPPLCIHSGFFFYQTKRIFAIRFCCLQPYYNSHLMIRITRYCLFFSKKIDTTKKDTPSGISFHLLSLRFFLWLCFFLSLRFFLWLCFFLPPHLCCSCWIM